MPALPPYLIELIWEQFRGLLPEYETDHPLGCHRPRVPERIVFEKLVQILVFGCAYERIADGRFDCAVTLDNLLGKRRFKTTVGACRDGERWIARMRRDYERDGPSPGGQTLTVVDYCPL